LALEISAPAAPHAPPNNGLPAMNNCANMVV